MIARRVMRTSILLVALMYVHAVPARAEPFRPGDVLRATFELRPGLPRNEAGEFDMFEFLVVGDVTAPIGQFSVRLFDRGRLLGTYEAANSATGLQSFTATFKAATSILTARNPTVVDFSSFNDGSFDGGIDFMIAGGRLSDLRRVSDDITIGFTTSAAGGNTGNLFAKSYEIIPSAPPVPEPGSLFLVAAGAIGAAYRRVRRPCRPRRQRGTQNWEDDPASTVTTTSVGARKRVSWPNARIV